MTKDQRLGNNLLLHYRTENRSGKRIKKTAKKFFVEYEDYFFFAAAFLAGFFASGFFAAAFFAAAMCIPPPTGKGY